MEANRRPTRRPVDGIRQRVVPVPVTAASRSRRPKFRVIALWGIVGAYIYLVAAPYVPAIVFSLQGAQAADRPTATPAAAPTATPPTQGAAQPTPEATPIPGPNMLKVDSMRVNGQIYEGATEATLDKGIWHRPNSSTPDKGGNTVLAAHRFMYLSGNDTFYSLDKVAVGDAVSLTWNGRRYDYQVYNTEVVSDRAVDIENPTAEPILTLYTCTPLWTSKDRLVVQARLVKPLIPAL